MFEFTFCLIVNINGSIKINASEFLRSWCVLESDLLLFSDVSWDLDEADEVSWGFSIYTFIDED